MDSPADYGRFADSAPRSGGVWFGDLNDTEFEIAFYEQILQRQPDYVQVLRVLGELLSRQGMYDRTLEIDRRLVELRPRDEIAHYNLACSLARKELGLLAVGELDIALELGYDDWEHLEVDPDLESLRGLFEFKRLLDKYVVTDK